MACLLVRGRGGGEDERRLAFSFSFEEKLSLWSTRGWGVDCREEKEREAEEDEKDGRRG